MLDRACGDVNRLTSRINMAKLTTGPTGVRVIPCRRFSEKTALVTGAASGIGAATARRLAAEGAHVICADRQEAVHAVGEQLIADGHSAQTMTLDQLDVANVARAIASLGDPVVHVLAANAAVALPERSIAEWTVDDWDTVHDTNLRGTFVIIKHVLRLLPVGRDGAVVVTASVSGLRGHPNATPYAASKAGLLGMVTSLAAELAASGIRVNAVSPGAVHTPLLDSVYGTQTAAVIDQAGQANPLGRVASPDDIAATIAFLGSTDARHVNGVNLVVDGGQSMFLR